jgi:hypothetical protein
MPEDITLSLKSAPNWTGAGAGGGAGAEIASPEAIAIVVAMALTGRRAKPLVMTVSPIEACLLAAMREESPAAECTLSWKLRRTTQRVNLFFPNLEFTPASLADSTRSARVKPER